jgi:hypothetical protein
MLSDSLKEFGDNISPTMLETLAFGCLSATHASQFKAFVKQIHNQYALSAILTGEMNWPDKPEDRDVLYFLAQSFRAHLIRELPVAKRDQSPKNKELAHQAKALLKQLARINFEIAQMVVTNEDSDGALPDWFMVEIARDLPRIVVK